MKHYEIGSIIHNTDFKASGSKPAVNFPIKLISYDEAAGIFTNYDCNPCAYCVFENESEGCQNTTCVGGLWVPVEITAQKVTNTSKEVAMAELLYDFVTDDIDATELRKQATKLLLQHGFLTFKKDI